MICGCGVFTVEDIIDKTRGFVMSGDTGELGTMELWTPHTITTPDWIQTQWFTLIRGGDAGQRTFLWRLSHPSVL